MAAIVVIGRFGTDGPSVWIDSHGVVHVQPGWNPEQMLEVSKAVTMLAQAASLKTPGLSQKVSGALVEFVQKEISGHVKDSGISIISV